LADNCVVTGSTPSKSVGTFVSFTGTSTRDLGRMRESYILVVVLAGQVDHQSRGWLVCDIGGAMPSV
jgi:hypothetical protein